LRGQVRRSRAAHLCEQHWLMRSARGLTMTDCQFVWSMVVQGVDALATLLLGVVAIWGDRIKAKLFGPRLELTLHDPQGELIPLRVQGGSHTVPGRYYHLRVINPRRNSPAHNVRVVLTGVGRPSADGQLVPQRLSGPIQLGWQHQYARPQFQTIGPQSICDLGYVVEGGNFHISTLFPPPNNVDGVVRPGEKVQLEIVAVADEVESKPLRVEIAWNGKWSEDCGTMAGNLVVREVGPRT